MRMIQRNLLPEVHINPINRDLVIVGLISLLIAVAFATIGVMVVMEL
jgi:hypothetical protein